MANVANDADDLVGLVAHSRHQAFAQCLFIRKRCLYELLADYDYFVALPDLLLGEVPPAPQRDSHCVEVVLIHATKVGAKTFIGRNGRTAFDCERHVVRLTTEWQLGNPTYRFDAR